MRNENDPKRMLEDSLKPCIKSGSHKSNLKYELIEQMSAPSRREVRRNMTPRKAILLAIVIVILSATAVWAYNHYRQVEIEVTIQDGVMKSTVTDDNGTREYTMENVPQDEGPVFVTLDENGEMTAQTEMPQDIKDAIANGNYTVVEEEEEINGEIVTLYHYYINLEDGRELELKLSERLEDMFEEEE